MISILDIRRQTSSIRGELDAGFLALMLVPCLMGVFKLFASRPSSGDPFAAGVTIYLAQACFSGGWGFIPLLMLGAFLSLTFERRTQFDRERFLVVSHM